MNHNKCFILFTAAGWFFVLTYVRWSPAFDITILSEFLSLLRCVNGLGKLQMNDPSWDK
jgi:hypothetical protein